MGFILNLREHQTLFYIWTKEENSQNLFFLYKLKQILVRFWPNKGWFSKNFKMVLLSLVKTGLVV